MRRSRGMAALVVLVGLVFLGYVAYPVAIMIGESLRSDGGFTFERYLTLLDPSNTANLEAVVNSVVVSLLSVVFSGLVGVLVAFVLTQFDFPFKKTLARLAVLPIALPPLVGVIAFLFVFGESGIIPRLMQLLLGTRSVPFFLDGISAIVVVHVYSFYVYYYLMVSEALERLDGTLLEAAASLGASSWRTFRSIVLPHVRPALTGASVLTFMSSMASFTAPLLFAGGRRFITLQIYSTKLNGDMELAAAQSVFLLLVSAAFFVALSFSGGRPGMTRQAKGATLVKRLAVSRFWRWVLIAGAALLLVIELLPIAAIVLLSFAREGSWTTQIFPQAYTSLNYTQLLADPRVFEPIGNSLVMALLTVAATLLFGTVASTILAKGGLRRSRRFWDIVLTIPYAIPGTVVAIALIMAFNRPVLPSGFSVLVGTFWILPLAYFVRLYPLVVRSAGAALEQVDDSVLEAAESLGAGVARRFGRIILPLIAPALVSGGMLVAISALGEFVSSVLLYNFSNRPISVEILAQLRIFNFGGATAYAVVLLIIILAVSSLAGRLSRRYSGGSLPLQS